MADYRSTARELRRRRWFRAADEGAPLLDAATGEEVARISSTGLDLAAMTDHARTRRRPRAPRADASTSAPACSRRSPRSWAATRTSSTRSPRAPARPGATRWSTSTAASARVFSYASKGTRELPNDTVVLDGAVEPLGREGTFLGRHVYTSRPGVAVQINAFNFPVWGMLEKLAPAFLAGLPSIVKPASQTAYLTELVVRRIIESGILPEGSLQLLCGSPAGLLEELGAQDSVAFTGSAATGAHLRAAPVGAARRGAARRRGRLAELLDPRAGRRRRRPGVRPVRQGRGHRDDRQGRPEVHRDPPRDRARAASPTRSSRRSRPGWRRSPSATRPTTASGWARWRASTSATRSARRSQALRGSAEIVYGDPDHVEVVDADAERGAFMSPVLLRAAAGAREPHDVEPFGPVSTVLAYDDARRGDRPGRPRARARWSARSSPTTPPSRAR